jgi:hypothetical protein
MPYRRHSNLKAGQFSRTSITGAGNVIKRAGGGPPRFTAEVTPVEHTEEADVELTGEYPELNLNFKIPEGEPPEFTATASSVSSTTPPDVDITGDYPNLNLAFKIPQGKDGVSPPPPTAITFTISGESGDHSAAYITGSYPNWHISLVLERGAKGDDGDVGPQGPPGICNCTCDCCNTDPPPCPSDMTFIRAVSTDDLYYDAGCGEWTIGQYIVNIVADGNCGEKEDSYYQYSVGEIGRCNGNIYYVDGDGNVTSEPEDGGGGEDPPPEDGGGEDPPPEDGGGEDPPP